MIWRSKKVSENLYLLGRYLLFMLVFLGIATLPTACSKGNKAELRVETEEELYDKAVRAVDRNKLEDALLSMEKLELEYPASKLMPDVTYLKATVLFGLKRYNESIATIDMFLRQFPYDARAKELLFTKSLNHYDQVLDVDRDQKVTEVALESLRQFMSLHPTSKFRAEAKLKAEYLEALLAGKEMRIGYYYFDRRNYTAALRRFRNVVDDYSTTIFAPEALYRSAETLIRLRMYDQARVYAAILGHNYPDSEWYNKIYANFQEIK